MRRVGALRSWRFKSPLEKIISATISNATLNLFIHAYENTCVHTRPMEPVRLSNYTSARVLTYMSFHQPKVPRKNMGDNTKRNLPQSSHVQWYLTFIYTQSNIAIFLLDYFLLYRNLRLWYPMLLSFVQLILSDLRISTFHPGDIFDREEWLSRKIIGLFKEICIAALGVFKNLNGFIINYSSEQSKCFISIGL